MDFHPCEMKTEVPSVASVPFMINPDKWAKLSIQYGLQKNYPSFSVVWKFTTEVASSSGAFVLRTQSQFAVLYYSTVNQKKSEVQRGFNRLFEPGSLGAGASHHFQRSDIQTLFHWGIN